MVSAGIVTALKAMPAICAKRLIVVKTNALTVVCVYCPMIATICVSVPMDGQEFIVNRVNMTYLTFVNLILHFPETEPMLASFPNKESYIKHNLKNLSNHLEIKFRFATQNMNQSKALILFMSNQNKNHNIIDFLSISLDSGVLFFTINLGHGIYQSSITIK